MPPIPPIRLEPLHRSLKHPFPRPLGGSRPVLLLALAAVIVLALYEAQQPVAPRKPVTRPMLSNMVSTKNGARRLSEHEKRLQEELRKYQEEQARQKEQEKEEKPKPVDLGPVPEGHVRVAAVQVHSDFGKPESNCRRLTPYIRRAVKEGARIVVLPELALHGFGNMNKEIYWSNGKPAGPDHVDARPTAETLDGPSLAYFKALAKELAIYLTVPFMEKSGDALFSAVTLLDPEGKALMHYRKRQPWSPGDDRWLKRGTGKAPVTRTPFGRLGLMISYDLPQALPELSQAKADILLWSAAFHGEHVESYFRGKAFRERIRSAGLHTVVANWTYLPTPPPPLYHGIGHSRIIGPEGRTMAKATTNEREMLVIKDIPIRK